MATTSTFNLRRLIQTKLHQDDEASDDEVSMYEDDQRNPIKKRITTWLGPRRGSTSVAAHSRSRSDVPRSLSPHPQPDHQYQQQVLEASELLIGGKSTERLASKRRTLDGTRSKSSLSFNDASSDLSHPPSSSYSGDSNHIRRRPCPITLNSSPRGSSHLEPDSPPIVTLDNSFVTDLEPDSTSMDTSHENRSDPTLNRRSATKDVSEGVRQLIQETDLAFEGVDSSLFDLPDGFELPRLSMCQDLSHSNPDLTSQLAPSPLVVDKQDGKAVDAEDVGPKAEALLDVPPRRTSRAKEEVLKTDRRKSRSVPPPIQVRRASSPEITDDITKPSPLAPAPKSARDASIDETGNTHNPTPPLKDTIHRPQRPAPQPAPRAQARRPSKTTRWAIPDNVHDILTGNMFKRHEVDELLTPEQLAKLKQERDEKASDLKRKESLARRRRSDESAKDVLAHKPERCPSKVKKACHKSKPSQESMSSDKSGQSNAGSETSASSNDSDDEAGRFSEDRASSGSEEDSEDRPPTPPKKAEGRLRKQAALGHPVPGDEDGDGLMTFDFLGAPSPVVEEEAPPLPPRKNSKRYNTAPTKELPNLPTDSNSKRKKVTDAMDPEEDDEFLYLKSTPYSLTLPSFRHGPIAFAKSEIGKGALTMDDTLDWTAFQMAILGAGELLPEMCDEGDLKFIADIQDWFEDFGFETFGHVVPEAWPTSPRNSMGGSSLSSIQSEHDLPLAASSQNQQLPYDTTKFFQGNGFKGYSLDGQVPKESQPSKDEHWSPPTTPGTPMVVDADDKFAAEEQDIPMGYNLQGDLGDFLQWEAQHALSSGYYGTY